MWIGDRSLKGLGLSEDSAARSLLEICGKNKFTNLKVSCLFQLLDGDDPDEIQKGVSRLALIFVGIGVFSGITNFIVVRSYSLVPIIIPKNITALSVKKSIQNP